MADLKFLGAGAGGNYIPDKPSLTIGGFDGSTTTYNLGNYDANVIYVTNSNYGTVSVSGSGSSGTVTISGTSSPTTLTIYSQPLRRATQSQTTTADRVNQSVSPGTCIGEFSCCPVNCDGGCGNPAGPCFCNFNPCNRRNPPSVNPGPSGYSYAYNSWWSIL